MLPVYQCHDNMQQQKSIAVLAQVVRQMTADLPFVFLCLKQSLEIYHPWNDSSPLKIGLNTPKGNDRIPTIHFQAMLVSGRAYDSISNPLAGMIRMPKPLTKRIGDLFLFCSSLLGYIIYICIYIYIQLLRSSKTLSKKGCKIPRNFPWSLATFCHPFSRNLPSN